MSLYDDLGVAKDADSEAIKRAYRKRAHKAHPDKGGTSEKFHAIQRAYDVLGDAGRRARYDATGDTAGAQDSMESRAMREVGAAIISAVMQCPDPDRYNIVADVSNAIAQKIDASKTEISEFNKKIAKYKATAARFKKKKKGPNILADMVEAQIDAMRRGIEIVKDNIELGKAMLKILADYDYEVDAVPRGGFISGPDIRFTNFHPF